MLRLTRLRLLLTNSFVPLSSATAATSASATGGSFFSAAGDVSNDAADGSNQQPDIENNETVVDAPPSSSSSSSSPNKNTTTIAFQQLQSSNKSIYHKLSTAIAYLEDADRKAAASAESMVHQLAFNEVLTSSVSDSLQAIIAAASSSTGGVATSATASSSLSTSKIDKLALEKSLSYLQSDFEKRSFRNAGLMGKSFESIATRLFNEREKKSSNALASWVAEKEEEAAAAERKSKSDRRKARSVGSALSAGSRHRGGAAQRSSSLPPPEHNVSSRKKTRASAEGSSRDLWQSLASDGAVEDAKNNSNSNNKKNTDVATPKASMKSSRDLWHSLASDGAVEDAKNNSNSNNNKKTDVATPKEAKEDPSALPAPPTAPVPPPAVSSAPTTAATSSSSSSPKPESASESIATTSAPTTTAKTSFEKKDDSDLSTLLSIINGIAVADPKHYPLPRARLMDVQKQFRATTGRHLKISIVTQGQRDGKVNMFDAHRMTWLAVGRSPPIVTAAADVVTNDQNVAKKSGTAHDTSTARGRNHVDTLVAIVKQLQGDKRLVNFGAVCEEFYRRAPSGLSKTEVKKLMKRVQGEAVDRGRIRMSGDHVCLVEKDDKPTHNATTPAAATVVVCPEITASSTESPTTNTNTLLARNVDTLVQIVKKHQGDKPNTLFSAVCEEFYQRAAAGVERKKARRLLMNARRAAGDTGLITSARGSYIAIKKT